MLHVFFPLFTFESTRFMRLQLEELRGIQKQCCTCNGHKIRGFS